MGEVFDAEGSGVPDSGLTGKVNYLSSVECLETKRPKFRFQLCPLHPLWQCGGMTTFEPQFYHLCSCCEGGNTGTWRVSRHGSCSC